MSRRKKLIEKIRARPVEAEYSDVERLMKDFGWTLDRTKGSHAIFTKPGWYPMSVPTKHARKVKRIYLDKICELLELDDIDLDTLED